MAMRRSARLAVLFAALAVAAAAAPGLAAAEGDKQPVQNDQSVTLATVALPLVVDGQIANYVFVSVKLTLTPHADSNALRDKEPYFRDALVRAAHRAPFVRPGDFNHLDEAKLKAAMYREATAIAGPGKILSVTVLSQTAQHRVATARPAGGSAIVP
jgi:hypothetical protein